MNQETELNDEEDFKSFTESSINKTESALKNGFPVHYHCPLNLAELRQQDEPVEILTLDDNRSFMQKLEKKSLPDTQQIMKRFEGWEIIDGFKYPSFYKTYFTTRALVLKAIEPEEGQLFGFSAYRSLDNVALARGLTHVYRATSLDEITLDFNEFNMFRSVIKKAADSKQILMSFNSKTGQTDISHTD